MKRKWLLSALLVSTLIAWMVWYALRAPQPQAALPATLPPAAYVDNQKCLSCHRAQADQWQGSHHAKAMALPTAQTVLGNFANAEFRHQGVTTRFFRKGDKFFIRTDGPDGKLADFEVAYTFGVAPLQQYLIALPGGRFQAFQVAWDDVKKRWFRLQPQEKAPAGDVLHWTGHYQTANTMCIECHTTGFEKRYDAATGTFDSRWKEVNVSCQACHGPGGQHVEWAQQRERGVDMPDVAGVRFGLSGATKGANAQLQVDGCAACHSRRSRLTGTPVPGQPRLDHYLPLQLTQGHFHPDGQQLDEVFVDASFRQSKMYQAGVACTACHNPHSGKLVLQGNAVCLQCHTPAGNAKFPAAKGEYDSPAHHHHPQDSAGAQCVACHMPSRTYMQIQSRPDHSLRIPRPDLTVKIGTPNACNGCHDRKSAAWAADAVRSWGGKSQAAPHYGEVFAAFQAGAPDAALGLATLAGDLRQSAIVRATALGNLSGDAGTGIATRIEATRDADSEVRASAADSFAAVPAAQRLYALTPLLRDPVRAVRMAAAHSLSSIPVGQMALADQPAFEAALAEYVAAQRESLDMPGANMNLASVYASRGHADEAERYYRAALKIDPDFVPARIQLATLYNASARNPDAVRVLQEGLGRSPRSGEMQYALGLLLAEERQWQASAQALTRATALMPRDFRAFYNLGLVLQKAGKYPQAVAALEAAIALDAQSVSATQALAVLYLQRSDRVRAREWARRWYALAPGDPQAHRLVGQLEAAAR